MKQPKVTMQSRAFLNAMYQQALVEGVTATNARHIKRPFTVKFKGREIVGGIECQFDLLAAAEELRAFFLLALFAHNEKHHGRTLDSYTKEEAGTLLERHPEERRRFIQLAFSLLSRQVIPKLEAAFDELLIEVKWQALNKLGLSVNADDWRKILREAERQTKLRIDTPSAGRRRGSKALKSDDVRQHEQAEFEECVIRAIRKLYSHNNSKPLRKTVAQEVGVSTRQLARKTKPGVGKTFEELVEIAEMRQGK